MKASQQKSNDKQIIERLKRGDKEAYSDLYNLHAKAIYRFVYFRVGSREVAEDIMQETFLKLIDVVDVVRMTNLRAYLYRIARNLVNDSHRAKSKNESVALDVASDAESVRGEGFMEASAELTMLSEALDELRSDWREIIILRHVESLTHQEIAQVIGRTSAYVRVNLHRATKALNAKFNSQVEGDKNKTK